MSTDFNYTTAFLGLLNTLAQDRLQSNQLDEDKAFKVQTMQMEKNIRQEEAASAMNMQMQYDNLKNIQGQVDTLQSNLGNYADLSKVLISPDGKSVLNTLVDETSKKADSINSKKDNMAETLSKIAQKTQLLQQQKSDLENVKRAYDVGFNDTNAVTALQKFAASPKENAYDATNVNPEEWKTFTNSVGTNPDFDKYLKSDGTPIGDVTQKSYVLGLRARAKLEGENQLKAILEEKKLAIENIKANNEGQSIKQTFEQQVQDAMPRARAIVARQLDGLMTAQNAKLASMRGPDRAALAAAQAETGENFLQMGIDEKGIEKFATTMNSQQTQNQLQAINYTEKAFPELLKMNSELDRSDWEFMNKIDMNVAMKTGLKDGDAPPKVVAFVNFATTMRPEVNRILSYGSAPHVNVEEKTDNLLNPFLKQDVIESSIQQFQREIQWRKNSILQRHPVVLGGDENKNRYGGLTPTDLDNTKKDTVSTNVNLKPGQQSLNIVSPDSVSSFVNSLKANGKLK